MASHSGSRTPGGKVVLVVFWATWCVPTAQEVPWLEQAYQAYHARGFQIVGINVDSAQDGTTDPKTILPAIRRFLLEFNIPWPTLINGQGDQDVTRSYSVGEIPSNVLIGRDGKVAHLDLVGSKLEKAVGRGRRRETMIDRRPRGKTPTPAPMGLTKGARSMTEIRRILGTRPARHGKVLALTMILLGTCVGRSQAFIGYGGGGIGFGFGFQNNAYTESNFLNSWSLQNAASAAANRPQPLVAPKFTTRDDSFYNKYDLQTRMSMINRVARDPGREMGTADPSGVLPQAARARPSPPPPTTTSQPPTSPTARFLLADFFDRNRRLVWPSIAPITGDMGKQQEVADLAILGVLNEHELRGLAQLSTVTEARRKLLDYGRPALDFVRKQTTPAMADSFHVFLLSLYSQIELAATTPRAPL